MSCFLLRLTRFLFQLGCLTQDQRRQGQVTDRKITKGPTKELADVRTGLVLRFGLDGGLGSEKADRAGSVVQR